MRIGKFIREECGKYFTLADISLLEIGIGGGTFGRILSPYVKKYYGIDINEGMVRGAVQNSSGAAVNYAVGDAERIPFGRNFDIVFYSRSWHLLEHYSKALAEADRVLKHGGVIVIAEPSKNSNRWKDARLIKGSPQFDEEDLIEKMESLERGRDALFEQRLFNVSGMLYYEGAVYLLKRKISWER